MIPHLEPWQWCLAAFCAFCVGVSKTGIAGVGIVSVALFPLVFDPKSAVGIALLVLISADCVAILSYPRSQVRWDLWRGVFPWAVGGVALGAVSLRFLHDPSTVRRLIGTILLLIVALQMAVRFRRAAPLTPAETDTGTTPGAGETAFAGILTGFATLVANAAGPVMILYLLPRKLPKHEFIATTAWFFFALNLLKVPFSVGAGMMNTASPLVAVCLLPAAVVGGVTGKWLLPRTSQTLFETVALVLTALASARLLWG